MIRKPKDIVIRDKPVFISDAHLKLNVLLRWRCLLKLKIQKMPTAYSINCCLVPDLLYFITSQNIYLFLISQYLENPVYASATTKKRIHRSERSQLTHLISFNFIYLSFNKNKKQNAVTQWITKAWIYSIFQSLFILSGDYRLLNAASYVGEILHAHACRPYAGHMLGFMSIGVVVRKIMTFFQKCV